MNNKTLNAYLITTILTLSIVPMATSFILLNEVLGSIIGISINTETKGLMQQYREDLKELKTLNPKYEEEYKQRFERLGQHLLLHEDPGSLADILRNTYITYYLILFCIIVLLSVLAAVFLSRRISLSYKTLTQHHIQKTKRLQELSYFDEWKEIAGKLAHEIKSPLTPIKMMISHLKKSYANNNTKEFQRDLDRTVNTINEEVEKLKGMVNHFSNFATLHKAHKAPSRLIDYLTDFIQNHENCWPTVNLTLLNNANNRDVIVNIDHLLIKQCLINIINNAVEAAKSGQHLNITITINMDKSQVFITIHNNGPSIPENINTDIFKMYFTTKDSKDNMGLGLPIVKKIMLDHDGDIHCLNTQDGAAFKIALPLDKHHEP